MPLQLWSHYFGSYYNGDKLSKTYFISTIKMSGSKHLLRMRGFVGAVIVIPKKLTGLQTLFKQYSNLELHFTGSLQTNKVKSALQIFQVFQTLDRERLAKEFLKFPIL